MKRLLAVALLGLTGCAYNMTLYPKGGGELATGTYNHTASTAQVTIKGVTYSGSVAEGSSMGFMMAGGTIRPMYGVSNQFSSVMTNGNRAIRCQFELAGFNAGGNGVCVDADNLTYDLVLK